MHGRMCMQGCKVRHQGGCLESKVLCQPHATPTSRALAVGRACLDMERQAGESKIGLGKKVTDRDLGYP